MWKETCAAAVKTGFVDGCFADRAVDGTLPMESRLENRLCHLTINCGGGKTYRGLAYNERCFGTLG